MTTEREEPANWRESPAVGETRDTALRRLRVRCWRRGTKEMDLLLGGFLDARGAELTEAELAAFDALTHEDDGLLYAWIAGGAEPPTAHGAIIATLRRHHGVV